MVAVAMTLHSPQSMMPATPRRSRVSAGVRRNAPRRCGGVAICSTHRNIMAQPGLLGANPAELVQAVPSQTIPVPLTLPSSQALPVPAVTTAPVMARMPVCFQSPGSDARRILCYGDSLTAGFCDSGMSFEPYGRTLADFLGKAGIASEVSVCGLSGRTAEEMISQKDSAVFTDCAGVDHVGKGLARILNDDSAFNVAVILVGTNDLGFAGCTAGLTANHILARVQQLHAICHQRGISTIALVPPCEMQGPMRVMQRQLAALLATWARKEPHVLALYDVEELVPRARSNGLWDLDDIHMSAAGQRMLGQRLAQLLPPVVEQRASETTLPAAFATKHSPARRDADPNVRLSSARSGKPVVGGLSPSVALSDGASPPLKLVGSPIVRFRAPGLINAIAA